MTAQNNLAYSYVRWSSAEQSKGDSHRRQLAKFEDYCTRKGLTPAADSFIDKGRSGYKQEHLNDTGELRRFLNLVEDGTIAAGSTLIVEDLDRLGRQEVVAALGVFTMILTAGIRIVTLGDGEGEREYTADSGTIPLLISLLEMSRAHGESKRKSELVSAAFANKQHAARLYKAPMGNIAPLWLSLKHGWRSYEADGSAYEEIPARAAVVRLIFQWAIDGYGKDVIARKLNDEGHLPFKANTKWKEKGLKGWGSSSVDKVLKNRAVFGEYQPTTRKGTRDGKRMAAGDAISGYFPATVSVETFYEAQAAIDGRRTARATRQSPKFNVWGGIAKCEKCGNALHLVNKGIAPKGSTYLRCSNSRKGVCKARAVRLDQAEAVFRGMLLRLDTLALVKDSSANVEKSLRAAEGELVGAEKTLADLAERLMENASSKTFATAVRTAEGRVSALQSRVESLKAELASENSIGWTEFLSRLDLVSYEGRAKANALCKRLGVVVMIGASGYGVTKNGKPIFSMDFREGEAGYVMPAFGGALPAFLAVSDVPSDAEREDADQARYASLEDEGQATGEY
ncbi:recombinase family protein [Cupriavidus plantarum]|uniref:DNA invertase Pin-like site-specific DNA recombinase n=1 Tax=Cupriavidus plantarum TaxID=942865 RepID=A0A316F4B4_9BURK|nr:recombinase family protein [Cupriavidus plantarum]PWK38668.1 DNA invertase Pin-like site-specific DNA recombinase [Cupriavidus plantarum]